MKRKLYKRSQSYSLSPPLMFFFFFCVYTNLLFAQEAQVTTLIDSINASGGITRDAVGNFYISDFGSGLNVDSNTIVYKIDKDDLSLSIFCDGFIGASGSCFDSQGNFYQSNNNGNRISKIHPDGIKEYTWVSEGLNQPIGIIADSQDNIFVCNCSGNYISKITPDGSISTFVEDPLFNCPNGLTIDPDGNLYTCNFSDGKVLKITPDATVSLFAELQPLSGGPSLVGNGHITYHEGYFYINLIGLGQVQRICPDGTVENIAGIAGGFSNMDGAGSVATFSKPNGIIASITGDTLLVNSSVPTWIGSAAGFHPGMVRMITGINNLPNNTCEGDPSDLLFSQITEGAIVENLTISMGSSWADYDNDGDMDVFICVASGNNQLYQNNGDLTFTLINENVSNDGGSSGSAVWGDYNNDGFMDLYVSNNSTPPALPEANFLYSNTGPPDFNLIKNVDYSPAFLENYTWSSTWVDYDNDGDIDLHVPENRHLGVDYFFVNNYPGTGGASYFTNFSNLSFMTDTIESTGVASWMDYDNDCDQDLFMIKSGRSHPNGFENNRLFHNSLQENGSLNFTRITSANMANHLDKDFQASWGDYDNDGDMDVYLGNFDGPNYLYRNEGDSLFTAITTGAPVEDNAATLGSTWGDFDNDGDLDLFVTNTVGQQSAYYKNEGDGNFTKQNGTVVGPPVVNLSNTQSCSNADINNDGYLDLFLANSAISPIEIAADYLYLNNGGENGYMLLTLKGTNSNAAGIGAKVRIKTMIDGVPTWQMRVVSGGPTGDRAQNSLRVHFGLGNTEIIDSMIVEWTNCQRDVYTNVFPDQICEITEGGMTTCQLEPGAFTKDQIPGLISFEVIPNPVANKILIIQYQLEHTDTLQFHLYDLNGQLLKSHISANTGHFQMSVPELSTGVYIIQLQTKEGSVSRRVTIP